MLPSTPQLLLRPSRRTAAAFSPPSTSYANTGGTGNRTASITITATGITFTGSLSGMLDGDRSGTGAPYIDPQTQAVSGARIKIDITSIGSKYIDEVSLWQNGDSQHGVWQWEGSNNGSTWTTISSTFTLGGSGVDQTVAWQSLSTPNTINAGRWSYYSLLGISGNTNQGAWPFNTEFEFKIEA